VNSKKISFIGAIVIAVGVAFVLFAIPPVSSEISLSRSDEAIARGEYLVNAGGCLSCHRGEEDAETMSGGLALETDFGTFYAPNITPDSETGVGDWSARDFIMALKHGRSPGGGFYYPAFPYRAYGGLSDTEVVDIGSYLMSLDAVSYQVPEPETAAWLFRWTVAGWNFLANLAEPKDEIFEDELVARGAYLAENLGHCSECHTPRNSLGILDASRAYAGATLGEEVIEAIDAEALSDWTAANFDIFLLIGLKPGGEFIGGDMNDVIEHNTSKLSDEDRDALAAYFTRHN
jgi:mono/diheme cytochrome c family protein